MKMTHWTNIYVFIDAMLEQKVFSMNQGIGMVVDMFFVVNKNNLILSVPPARQHNICSVKF
jgi:hypothetical protein